LLFISRYYLKNYHTSVNIPAFLFQCCQIYLPTSSIVTLLLFHANCMHALTLYPCIVTSFLLLSVIKAINDNEFQIYLNTCITRLIHNTPDLSHYHTPITINNLSILMFRVVFCDILPCKMIVERRFRGAYCLHHQTSVDNNFTRHYIPEDNSEHHTRRRENLKSQNLSIFLSHGFDINAALPNICIHIALRPLPDSIQFLYFLYTPSHLDVSILLLLGSLAFNLLLQTRYG
jgi:hypothetical protein